MGAIAVEQSTDRTMKRRRIGKGKPDEEFAIASQPISSIKVSDLGKNASMKEPCVEDRNVESQQRKAEGRMTMSIVPGDDAMSTPRQVLDDLGAAAEDPNTRICCKFPRDDGEGRR